MSKVMPEVKNTLTWIFVDMDHVSEWYPDLTEFGYDYGTAEYQAVNQSHAKRVLQGIVSICDRPNRLGLEKRLREIGHGLEGVTFVRLKVA